jgi:hypothetical protein
VLIDSHRNSLEPVSRASFVNSAESWDPPCCWVPSVLTLS